jgi:hypothetical protein
MKYGYFFVIVFFVRHICLYFLGFFKKALSLLFVHSHARKSMRMQPSIFFSFCVLIMVTQKVKVMEYLLSSFHAP